MEFPVDLLASVSHEHLERSGHAYMDDLLHGDPEDAPYFLLPSGRKVPIGLSSVGFVPLYGANLEHKILALFGPEDPLTAVALLLSDRWYAVENVLRTSSAVREGLFQVTSVVERVVLYVLNRIIYRTNEMAAGDIPFLCHDKNDYAKILWKGGEAVGFYSVQTKGRWSQFYCLPVMNSIFVRKGHRGNGHGLQMLEDFVDSFSEDELGLKYPLSAAMLRVCQRYLARYPADMDLLWEVEGVGGPYQRSHLASRLSAHALTGCQDGHKNGTVAEGAVNVMGEPTLDITEEAVVNKHLTPAEEVDYRPISTRTRSSENGWRKREREEPVEGEAEVPPQKISRGAEQLPESLEPCTAAISTPEHEDGAPPGGVMAVLSVSCAAEQEAKELGSEETVPGQAEEEKSSLQNGTAEEEQEEIQVAVHSVDTLQDTGGGAIMSRGKEQEQEMDKDPVSDKEEVVANDTAEEKSAAEVEGEQIQEVTGEVGVAENAEKHEAPFSFVEEQEEEGPPEEEEEEPPEGKQEEEEPSEEEEEEPSEGKREAEGEKVSSLKADEKQEADRMEEEVEEVEEVEPVRAEAPPPEGETTNPEETTGTPVKGGGPEAPEDEERLCVSQVEEDLKENEQEEEKQKEGRMESQEKVVVGGAFHGNAPDMPDDGRVPRGGRSKTCSLRKSGTAGVQEEEGQGGEDERVTTEEEEEDEEPHVMDMRVLRRNTRTHQSTTQHRVKRRSKM